MRISLPWVLEYVDVSASPREAARLLTMSGTNVEKVEGDELELEITPNRGDCLSMIGVAREMGAASGRPLNLPDIRLNETGNPTADSVTVDIEAPDLCPRYSARLLRNVKNGPSPAWMQERLIASGMRPINVIVDVTNYVMLEYGQPLHAFDFERVRGNKIVVRRAQDKEVFTTLDEQERILDSSILMICDGEGPVAIAGIMGGRNSEVSETTQTVLLESAHFDAMGIRAAAKKLNLRTESSYRFERIVDPGGTVAAVDRAAQLLQELAGAEVAPGVVDNYPGPSEPRSVLYRPERGDRLIGQSIPPEEQQRYLDSLGLNAEKTPDGFQVAIPTFRPDLAQEDDIAEEVGRIFGYENITYRLPGGGFFGKLSESLEFSNRVRHILSRMGLTEVLTHSLTDPSHLARFGSADPRRVRNPLSEELAALRTSLIPMLVDLADRNARNGIRDIHVFEVGQVFLPTSQDEGVEKSLRVAGLLCGSRMEGHWNLKPVPLESDFFAAKGVIEGLLIELLIEGVSFEAATATGLHPGRTARLLIAGESAGILGQIHPQLEQELDLPGPTYVFELEMKPLHDAQCLPQAAPLPRFPGIARDLAVLVGQEIEAGRIRDILLRTGGEHLEDVTLFDVYDGKGIPEGQKSLAFSLRFRSLDRTLADEDITAAVTAMREALAREVGASER